MAYGKYFDESKFQIDYDCFMPVFVLVTFNPDGNMRPDMIQIINQDELKESYKIQGVKNQKLITGGIQYVCLINSFNCIKEIKLTFFIQQHLWCVER